MFVFGGFAPSGRPGSLKARLPVVFAWQYTECVAVTWAEADVRCAFGKSRCDPEANGWDGSYFGKNLTVFFIPTSVTGVRKAIGSMRRCLPNGNIVAMFIG